MTYSTVLFDLDGTLTDPYEGISKSFLFALERFGVRETDIGRLRGYIGPPLRESFRDNYGFSGQLLEEVIKVFRERFANMGLYENRVYDGIPELLCELVNDGLTLALATSKVTGYAQRILSHFGLEQYFTFVGGSEFDGTRSDKSEVIEYVLESLHITDRARVLMVGDRFYDLTGAATAGIDAAGVLWGYGSENELKAYKHEILLREPPELTAFIKNHA